MKNTKEKTLDEQIQEKRDELKGIHAAMEIYLAQKHPVSVASEIRDLEDRLEFRIKQYELKLLEEKIEIYGKVLSIFRPK